MNMKVNAIKVCPTDIPGSASALAGGVLQMLDASVTRMTEEQATDLVAGMLAGIAGGLSGRLGLEVTVVLFEAVPKIVREAAAVADAAQRKH
ncbi:hypothetical protein [Stenotrophomonas sp. PS02298]|uniref:hypothetical protein n=1 Tax=Stenotrophomonas sp. PS02298 TaxID=2991424 RepID=UPI00249C69B9|nr:hypothetical protein [Stenotrophomonas sp. PS02298]